MKGPTADDIRAWPATVDPATAATAFGISRSYAYELVKRGEFPAKVLKVGRKNRVVTADILRALNIPQNANGAGPVSPATATNAVPSPKDNDAYHGNPTGSLRAVAH